MSPLVLRKNSASRRKYWEEQAALAKYDARQLAERCQISLRQLQRYFKQDFGKTPREWLSERRIKDARELLFVSGSIKEVAYRVGFKQPSHFCREFKRWFGTTASEYCAHNSLPSINRIPVSVPKNDAASSDGSPAQESENPPPA